MFSVSAISGPVKRNRRNAAIASTRSAGVWFGELAGADDRSSKPGSPSARNRRHHFRQVLAETANCSVASAIDVLPSATIATMRRRAFRLRAALA
jgi:hypothetical protein